VILASAGPNDAADLAQAHARGFKEAWSAEDIAAILSTPGGYAIAAREEGEPAARGFILARANAGEAEILTLAVDPVHRRRGLGRALVDAALAAAITANAEAVFLEVAADNAAAIGLYEAAGFERVGTRRGYYARPGQIPIDALVLRHTLMRHTLNSGRG
jgi:ribosomal-protein-alanine N-acetyltransferase